ncbi:MAG TPA: tetratricopeptide repeat protein [Pyrinomonadaceae bacterium]|nr:tetratricopeptide repeat protein [Pyrinomonadaceae bacterium]
MRRFALTLCALLCLLAAAPAAPAKDQWTSVRSKNFFLVGNASEKEIRRVAERLEQFRDVFTRLFSGANFKSPVPTTVVVFKGDGAYKPFKPLVDGRPSDVAGYFQPGDDVNYITLTPPRGTEDPFQTIYHEFVHLLVDNTLGRSSVPAWFNEGLAEYYSTFDIVEGRKVWLGKLDTNHLYLLRRSKLQPLQVLFALDNESLHRNKRDAKQLFYAQSWALVHYLILGNGGKRLPQVNQFISAMSQNRPLEAAFREAFQTDFAGMEKELRRYVDGSEFKAQVATFERKLEFDAEMQSAPLSDAEAEAHLGDLLLHTNRPEEAVKRLEEAVRLDPRLGMAHASLGMAYMRLNRFDNAKRHLREAVAASAQNYLAHYYYAFTLSREGTDEAGFARGFAPETEREIRAALRRAIELNPGFPESYHLLAFVNLVTDRELAESVELLKRARALAPGNANYALILAQIYLRQENYAAARATVEPLTRDTADPQWRGPARSILSAIEAVREQAERHKAAREEAAREEASGTPPATDEAPRLRRRAAPPVTEAPAAPAKSDDEMAAEALTEAVNAALRKPLEGETRARGVLKAIECSPKGLVFVVKAGERTLRLTSQGFEDLHVMAFTREAGSELTCGPRATESAVVVTYRPDARPKSDGSLAALEFVPAGFTLP